MLTIITCTRCDYEDVGILGDTLCSKCHEDMENACEEHTPLNMDGVPYADYEDADAYDEEREREQDEKDFANSFIG